MTVDMRRDIHADDDMHCAIDDVGLFVSEIARSLFNILVTKT